MKVEAACGSGAAALRMGLMAVASGMHDVVLVCGVEKMTDALGDADHRRPGHWRPTGVRGQPGDQLRGLNALLMRRYMHEYDVTKDAFAGFTVNAHRNGVRQPERHVPQPDQPERPIARAGMIADPINLMDSSPVCDGAACARAGPGRR